MTDTLTIDSHFPVDDTMQGKVRSTIEATVVERVPALHSRLSDLLARISTPNWMIEWGLATWLGESFGTAPQTVEELLVGDITLIALARVTDDLADGESDRPNSDVVLATTLHQVLFDSYQRIFHSRESWGAFWPHFDDGISRWMRGTITPSVQLSDRGAFLRISTAASCIAAHRADVLGLVNHALDELLVGVVMLDDYFDWCSDVRTGRHNTFVGCCTGTFAAAEPSARDALFRSMVKALYTDAAGARFLDGAGPHLEDAAGAARQAGCDGLAVFVEWYRSEVDNCAFALERQVRAANR